jgi:hypothetical protein
VRRDGVGEERVDDDDVPAVVAAGQEAAPVADLDA